MVGNSDIFFLNTILKYDGTRPIEGLVCSDVILTRDNGLQPIQRIGSSRLSSAALSAAPNIRPVRIKAGALGQGAPSSDLAVSPPHRILVWSKNAQRIFGTNEVLGAAQGSTEKYCSTCVQLSNASSDDVRPACRPENQKLS